MSRSPSTAKVDIVVHAPSTPTQKNGRTYRVGPTRSRSRVRTRPRTAHAAWPVMNEPPMAPTPWPIQTAPVRTRTTPMISRAHTGRHARAIGGSGRSAVLGTPAPLGHGGRHVRCGGDTTLQTPEHETPGHLHERGLGGVVHQLVHLDPRPALGGRLDPQIADELAPGYRHVVVFEVPPHGQQA